MQGVVINGIKLRVNEKERDSTPAAVFSYSWTGDLWKSGNMNVQSRENPAGESLAGYGIFCAAMPGPTTTRTYEEDRQGSGGTPRADN
jgi:hypothetical protein